MLTARFAKTSLDLLSLADKTIARRGIQREGKSMITIQFEVLAKSDKIDFVLDFARRALEMTHEQDSGFTQYVFHQHLDNPSKFSLWEK